MFDVDGIVHG